MACLLITHARADRVPIWVDDQASSFVPWLVEWDGGLGFECTIQVPAPSKSGLYWKCFSSMEIVMTEQTLECSGCGVKKSLNDYYQSKGRCKACIAAYQKAYRDKKNANKPVDWKQKTKDKKAYMDKWNAANPGYSTLKKREWWQRNKDRLKVKWAVIDALKSGKINKQPCFVCGELKVEAHHADYSAPLAISWLCKQHHLELHKEHKHRLLSQDRQ